MGSEVSSGNDMALEDAWDVRRAAQFLGTSDKTLYRWAAEGRVPSFKMGGLLRFSPKALATWRTQQSRGGGQ